VPIIYTYTYLPVRVLRGKKIKRYRYLAISYTTPRLWRTAHWSLYTIILYCIYDFIAVVGLVYCKYIGVNIKVHIGTYAAFKDLISLQRHNVYINNIWLLYKAQEFDNHGGVIQKSIINNKLPYSYILWTYTYTAQ